MYMVYVCMYIIDVIYIYDILHIQHMSEIFSGHGENTGHSLVLRMHRILSSCSPFEASPLYVL